MGLTPKQEKFCQGIVKGLNPSEAYEEAYGKNNCSDATIAVEAQKTLNLPKISLRIEQLREEVLKEIKFDYNKAMQDFDKARSRLEEQNNWVGFAKVTKDMCELAGLYEDKDGVNVSVTMMPTVKINGKELELDIGDEPDR